MQIYTYQVELLMVWSYHLCFQLAAFLEIAPGLIIQLI